MPHLAMIVAASTNDVIGVDGDLPWRISADLKRFKRLTMGHHILMGRKTYDSIGRPLPGRTTVVITRQPDLKIDGVRIAHGVQEAIEMTRGDDCPFVVGGAEIYAQAMPQVDRIFLTRVHQHCGGDTVLPPIDWSHWEMTHREEGHQPEAKQPKIDFAFEDYRIRD